MVTYSTASAENPGPKVYRRRGKRMDIAPKTADIAAHPTFSRV